jgi:hypothetical protein
MPCVSGDGHCRVSGAPDAAWRANDLPTCRYPDSSIGVTLGYVNFTGSVEPFTRRSGGKLPDRRLVVALRLEEPGTATTMPHVLRLPDTQLY